MASPILVHLKVTASIESDPDDVRERTLFAAMDPDLIRNAASFNDAVQEFLNAAHYSTKVLNAEYFEISKWRYDRNYWRTRKARKV